MGDGGDVFLRHVSLICELRDGTIQETAVRPSDQTILPLLWLTSVSLAKVRVL
jgi:hypothetical protein